MSLTLPNICNLHCMHFVRIWKNSDLGFWERFLAVLGPQNPRGSCAARNVQNFGGTTCSCHCCIGSWMVSIWIMNMACRDGYKNSLKQPFKQYCSRRPGKSVKIMAGANVVENFGKLKISQDPTIRFEFPFVQPQFRSCSFGWWSGELPENSLSKVWTSARSAKWWWKFEKFDACNICHLHYTICELHCSALHHISENTDFGFRERFLAGLGPQNPLGSCAARNVQNFGGATCSCHCCIGSWMVSMWIMNMAWRDGYKTA